MKLKVLLTCILIGIAVISTNAQPPQGGGQWGRMEPEDMAKTQTERMVEELKLNEKQKTEAQAINLKYSKKIREIFQAGGGQGDWEANRKKMDEVNTQKNAELKIVFTAEQYKKHEELEKQRQEERRKRMGERQGGAPGSGQRGGQRGGPRL
jgi:uncharacterized protein YfdQ (DUF2303 family)